jgi:hypothetical protein
MGEGHSDSENYSLPLFHISIKPQATPASPKKPHKAHCHTYRIFMKGSMDVKAINNTTTKPKLTAIRILFVRFI